MAQLCTIRRHGVTLVEVLISLGVVGILVAISLGLVQSLRERSRRLSCSVRLRDLGIACQSHVAQEQVLPYTAVRSGLPNKIIHSVSPHVALIPFLDLPAGLDQFLPGDRFEILDSDGPIRFDNPINSELSARRIVPFLCPSELTVGSGTNYRANVGFGASYWLRPGGLECHAPSLTADGAFENGVAIHPGRFRDGLSSTCLFSEKLIGDANPNQFTVGSDSSYVDHETCNIDEQVTHCRRDARPDINHDSWGGTSWPLGGLRQTWYSHIVAPNSPVPDCRSCRICVGGGEGIYSARSHHPGGVNVVFADAHCEFISDAIDLGIWRAMSTKSGNDSVSDQ